MNSIDRFRKQWTDYHEVFGWSLPVWTPEMAEFFEKVQAGRQNPLLWIGSSFSRLCAAGWMATRDARYARAARVALEQEVLQEEPTNLAYPSLTQAYRLQVWVSSLGWLMDTDPFDSAFCGRILEGFGRLTRRLMGHTCPASMNWRGRCRN